MMLSAPIHSTVRVALTIAATLLFVSCTPKKHNLLRVWHFWSQPQQKQSFMELVHEFEIQHPDVHVETTELQWSDGKAKLQSAFAASQPPDVIQIGLEWVNQFATAHVLDSIPINLMESVPRQLLPSVQHDGHAYAMPWVMNCRSLFIHRTLASGVSGDTSKDSTIHSPKKQTWTDLRRLIETGRANNPSLAFGVNSYEPHNVLKKVLPFLWSGGSEIFSTVPFANSFDEAAVRGLQFYVELSRMGTVESSRQLDERMKRGELSIWMSGIWNLSDSAIQRQYNVAPAMFVDSAHAAMERRGPSIVSSDCFAVTANSSNKTAAFAFVTFLSQLKSSVRFCSSIPDAGLPAKTLTHTNSDSVFHLLTSPNHLAFYQQLSISRPLPSPSYFLEAEAILEEEIMEAVYERKSPTQALADAQRRIDIVEKHSAIVRGAHD